MNYSDFPTITQWYLDTTETYGSRENETLLPLDNAINNWKEYQSSKKSNWDTELLILSGIRYGSSITWRGMDPRAKAVVAIQAIGALAERLLLDLFTSTDSRKLDQQIGNALSTGMSDHGQVTDTTPGQIAKYITKHDESTRGRFEVFCDNGKLLQYKSWTNKSDSEKIPVCTMNIASMGLDYVEYYSEKAPFFLWKSDFEKKFGGFVRAYSDDSNEQIDNKMLLPYSAKIYIRACLDDQQRYYVDLLPDGNESSITRSYDFVEKCRNGGLKIGEGTDLFEDERGTKYKKIVLIDEFLRRSAPVKRFPRTTKTIGWKSRYGTPCGRDWGGYVLGCNDKLYMAEHSSHAKVFHSYYFAGKPIVCAGSLLVDGNGVLRAISNRSGHYQPAISRLMFVLQYFNRNGVDISDVLVCAHGNGVDSWYRSQDFLRAHGSPCAGKLDEKAVKKSLEKIKIFSSPDDKTMISDFDNQEKSTLLTFIYNHKVP